MKRLVFPKQGVAIFYKKQTEKNEVVARPGSGSIVTLFVFNVWRVRLTVFPLEFFFSVIKFLVKLTAASMSPTYLAWREGSSVVLSRKKTIFLFSSPSLVCIEELKMKNRTSLTP